MSRSRVYLPALLLLVISAHPSTAQPASPTTRPTGDPRIIEQLETLVRLHEARVKFSDKNFEIGRNTMTDMTRDRLDLAEARIVLAAERGEGDVTLRELRPVLDFFEKASTRAERIYEQGRLTPHELATIQSATIHLRIRVLREERKAAATTQPTRN